MWDVVMLALGLGFFVAADRLCLRLRTALVLTRFRDANR